MHVDCSNWIGGEWSETSASTENRCPANTEELIGLAPDSGEDEAHAAVAAAKAASEDWRRTTAPQRGAYLYRLVRLLEENTDRLAEAGSRGGQAVS